MSAELVFADLEVGNLDRTWRTAVEHASCRPGARNYIVGAANSGKSHLLMAIAGIADPGMVRGRVCVGDTPVADLSAADRTRRIALIPADPSLLFSGLHATVRGELELSLSLAGAPIDQVRVDKMVLELGLAQLQSQDPFALSGGQQVRAALAAALIKQPEVLILDDIFASLDPDGVSAINLLLNDLCREGMTVVEAHTVMPPWTGDDDLCLFLGTAALALRPYRQQLACLGPEGQDLLKDADRLKARLREISGAGFREATETYDATARNQHIAEAIESRRNSSTKREVAHVTLNVEGLSFRYGPREFSLGPLRLEAPGGVATAVIGPNGSGKTTLLRLVACLLDAEAGSLSVRTRESSRWLVPDRSALHQWAASVLYLFQNPDDQIHSVTVWDEITETARLAGKTQYETVARHIAVVLALEGILDQAPMDQPRSVRRLISLASLLVAAPPVILLDEPTASLDVAQVRRIKTAIHAYLAGGGTALIVSHDHQFLLETCSQAVAMREGHIDAGPISMEEAVDRGACRPSAALLDIVAELRNSWELDASVVEVGAVLAAI